eukprot:gene6003-6612_t
MTEAFEKVWHTDLKDLTVGFLGCGKISSALCRGFAGLDADLRPKQIFVSRRSEEKSTALANDFPSLVVVCDDNAEIVRQADVVFIGLLPAVARAELPKLSFQNTKFIISMMAAVKYDETLSLLQVHGDRLVRTVPLPSAARRSGPILCYPANPLAESLLSYLGNPVSCATEQEMQPMISITGHISSFFELMRCSQDFLVGEGIAADAARTYVTSFYHSLAHGALVSEDSLEEMRDEAATPGGLNEQSLAFLTGSPHFALHEESLLAILNRLRK